MISATAPTKVSPEGEAATGHAIIDVIEVRVSHGALTPGFILVPAGFRLPDPSALIGRSVVIEPPGGWAIMGKIAGTRDHGATTSLLVENWPADFPRPQVGWRVEVPDLKTPTGPEVLDRRAILDRLNTEAPALRAKYAVKSLAVFGSMARGDDHEESDVDVLVTFEGKPTFRNFMGLKLDLEDLFGRRVDLGTPNSLRPEMRANVEKDLIHVP